MGIPVVILEMICKVAAEQRGGLACSAGYPDILVTQQQLEACVGAQAAARIPARPDSAEICAWFGVSDRIDRVVDSVSLFKELGYELDVIDLHTVRGNEILLDLNLPVTADLHETYDLVVDPGTCEHCFNIGQAAMNLAAMVREGGTLIQTMPLNMFNHGFYNINPTWVFDFYLNNGYRILFMKGICDTLREAKVFELPPYMRFYEVPQDSGILLVARREVVRPLRIPVQYKYVSNPTLKRTAPTGGPSGDERG